MRVRFAIPGDLDSPTGGYAYDRRVIAGLRARGHVVDVVRLADRFPVPEPGDLAEAVRLLARADDASPIVLDGLAFGVMDAVAAEIAATAPIVALVHHPLACEPGVGAEQAARLVVSERAALGATVAVIANSQETARALRADYGVSAEALTVAEPGVDHPPAFVMPRDTDEPHVLAVGTVTIRKAHHQLVEALARLKDRRFRLTIVGDPSRSAEAVGLLEAAIAASGIGERIRLAGAIDDRALADLYADTDLFALASTYEGYGMVFAEAIVHGLPVVCTTGGAIKDVVPESAGLRVPPGDVDALAGALAALLDDPDLRRRKAAGARAVAPSLPTWEPTIDRFDKVLTRIAAGARPGTPGWETDR